MMPFVQGDSSSLPEFCRSYAVVIDDNYLERGQIGFLTIQESFVSKGRSQRGYNSAGSTRNVHVEVGRHQRQNWWGNTWGGSSRTLLADETRVLIANSVSDSCRFWDTHEFACTADGDLSALLNKYPEHTGRLMKRGELANISIFTPHECVPQWRAGLRQFFRIVGRGVTGSEPYFTPNPLLKDFK